MSMRLTINSNRQEWPDLGRADCGCGAFDESPTRDCQPAGYNTFTTAIETATLRRLAILALLGYSHLPIMIAANIVLTVLVGFGLGVILWEHPPTAWGVMQSVGACLLGLGFVLWTLARFQLGKSLTVTAQAKKLVTRGLYSRIRNPIYVFASCVIAGLILVFERPLWLLVFLIVIPLQIWRARKEASVLEETFGEEYRRYRTGTWF